MNFLKDKHILVTGGTPKEVIDGVRHYANHARPESHGLEAAKRLAEEGAYVTLIAPKLHDATPQSVEIISHTPEGKSIISAQNLVAAAEYYASERDGDIAAVLHLANISSLRPAHPTQDKLKIKKKAGDSVLMEVRGNIDLWGRLEAALPGTAIIGYQNGQLTVTADNAQVDALLHLAEEARHQAEKKLAATQIEARRIAYGPLAGRKIVMTNGPTAEQLTAEGDVITNFSSGRQGYALAQALAGMGAQVVVITGPTHLPDLAHPNVKILHVVDARDMRDKVLAHLPADVFVGVAAVADFGMAEPLDLQLREGQLHTLQLTQNPDILETVGNHPDKRPAVVIGFAAETAEQEQLIAYARGKLERKRADAICANQVGGEAIAASGSARNQIIWVSREGEEFWDPSTKEKIGEDIGRKIAQLLP
ncbi:MAG: hypothetical protein KGJ06_01975 [Pseudomonadota bacterium]|nr:hypothetical protein [Pseudomonadota bacterium]